MTLSLDSQSILTITTLVLLPLLYFILKPKSSSLPPGPISWPILSTIHYLLKPMNHVALADLARVYGPLMLLRHGKRLLIVGSSPPVAMEILKASDRILSARAIPQAMRFTANHLTFWDDELSDQWKRIRTMCQGELFSNKTLEAQAKMMEEKVAEMVEWLRCKEGLVVNVQHMIYATVVNMISCMLFSRDIVGLDEEDPRYEQVRGLLRGIIQAVSAPNLCDLYPFLQKLDPQGLRKKHREFSTRIWGLWETLLRDRRTSNNEQSDFLDALISKGFMDDQINRLFQELLTAGVDTTASTITRTMKELIGSLELMTRLQQELDSHVQNQGEFKFEQLPYLQACMKETLRLHPPAPTLLSHRAREACQVMNYTIPKNARVLVNVWAIGRDPTLWENPCEYRPQRFLNSALDFKGNNFEFLPFGSGRRICPGMSLAAKIVPLVVASLVHSFDWSSPHGSSDEMFRTTSQMGQPLCLIPRARKSL